MAHRDNPAGLALKAAGCPPPHRHATHLRSHSVWGNRPSVTPAAAARIARLSLRTSASAADLTFTARRDAGAAFERAQFAAAQARRAAAEDAA
jgi:hypothetical protein